MVGGVYLYTPPPSRALPPPRLSAGKFFLALRAHSDCPPAFVRVCRKFLGRPYPAFNVRRPVTLAPSTHLELLHGTPPRTPYTDNFGQSFGMFHG